MMNRTLVLAFARERLASPVRVLLLVSFWGLSLVGALMSRQVRPPGPENTLWLTLILGAGVIGRDLASGVLQLILARPVGRAEYVWSRWLGLSLCVSALAATAWLLVLPFALSNGDCTLLEALRILAEHLLLAFGLSAVITGLSSLVSGFGDLGLLLLGYITAQILGFIGKLKGIAWLDRFGDELATTLVPQIRLDAAFQGGEVHFYPFVTWLTSVTLFLLLAHWALRRKEFSYAAAG